MLSGFGSTILKGHALSPTLTIKPNRNSNPNPTLTLGVWYGVVY